MNERIKELLEQAGVKYVTLPKDTVYEKFTELIVRECVDIVDEYDGCESTIVSRIKKTFRSRTMKTVVGIVIYVFAFIVTYGHAYHQVGSSFPGENAVGAFISSLFWPLYWSVQIWS